MRKLQIAYTLGTVVFSTVPGILADKFGSYVPSYYILALVALTAAFLQQSALLRRERKRR